MKKYLMLATALTVFVVSVSAQTRASAAQAAGAASQASGGPASPGLAILNRSCTSCHDAGQVKQVRPAADWQPIIERMRNNGASISDGDAKILLDYLVKSYSARP